VPNPEGIAKNGSGAHLQLVINFDSLVLNPHKCLTCAHISEFYVPRDDEVVWTLQMAANGSAWGSPEKSSIVKECKQ